MAKRKKSRKSHTGVSAKAESWYGVSHNVPRRGTAAHTKMVSAYLRAHPRHNPVTTRAGRTLHPENCPIPLSASLMDARRDAGRAGKRKPVRFGNCDYRSAAYTMHFKPRGAGSAFSGTIERGVHPTADWITHSKHGKRHVDLSFWLAKHRAAPSGGHGGFLSGISRMLGWWPSSK